nr:MAG TPA: hypothetical protein [Caudoviricetes sp.]
MRAPACVRRLRAYTYRKNRECYTPMLQLIILLRIGG